MSGGPGGWTEVDKNRPASRRGLLREAGEDTAHMIPMVSELHLKMRGPPPLPNASLDDSCLPGKLGAIELLVELAGPKKLLMPAPLDDATVL